MKKKTPQFNRRFFHYTTSRNFFQGPWPRVKRNIFKISFSKNSAAEYLSYPAAIPDFQLPGTLALKIPVSTAAAPTAIAESAAAPTAIAESAVTTTAIAESAVTTTAVAFFPLP